MSSLSKRGMIHNVIPVHSWLRIMKQSTCYLNRSEHKANASSQSGEHVWSLKESATKAEIIASLQFAADNVPFSCAENLAECYQEQFPDSHIAKNVTIVPTNYVIFSFICIGTILQLDDYERYSRKAFLFHTALWWKSKSLGEKMDLHVCYWCEVDNGVKIRYLISIMFGHAKVQDVLAKILKALEILLIPLKTILSLGIDGSNVNNPVLNIVKHIKKKRGYQQLVTCQSSCLIHVYHDTFKKGIWKYVCNIE